MEATSALIVKLTSLADMAHEPLKIVSNPDNDAAYATKYTISIGDSVYYTDSISSSSLIDALMFLSMSLSQTLKERNEGVMVNE